MNHIPVHASDLAQTCRACPSQWEGPTLDGRFLYIRYRWGRLQAGVGPTLDLAVDSTLEIGDRTPLFSQVIGERFDGVIQLAPVMVHLRSVVRWST